MIPWAYRTYKTWRMYQDLIPFAPLPTCCTIKLFVKLDPATLERPLYGGVSRVAFASQVPHAFQKLPDDLDSSPLLFGSFHLI